MTILLKLAFAFGFMVALLESVVAAVKWGRGEVLSGWEWGMVSALPVLIGIYLRYFSIFGRGKGQCLLPPDDAQR